MFRTAVIVATLFAAAGFSSGALVGPASAQSADEAAGIQLTIRSQIEAMQVDDWDRAFEYASPTIQGVFRNPENFSRMVTNGYPMVWRPKTYRAGALTETPRGLMQTMIFEDRQGRLFIADYLMQEIDGEWRINGVSIRPAPTESA
ncbi:DUF4864 domain-containing protein [Pikeienuella piscinae]|uniref:DUF4864 domain-containing protein n=2 Tax=Pikeienuella piscinae TaxID=2748098 RepID=A0A7M3T733_9RHOB|nr:DUF4864 domain-containing protein [Pikeienuella piscinae]